MLARSYAASVDRQWSTIEKRRNQQSKPTCGGLGPPISARLRALLQFIAGVEKAVAPDDALRHVFVPFWVIAKHAAGAPGV